LNFYFNIFLNFSILEFYFHTLSIMIFIVQCGDFIAHTTRSNNQDLNYFISPLISEKKKNWQSTF